MFECVLNTHLHHISRQRQLWQRFKGAPSGLIQFLLTQNPLITTKNALYFTLKSLFILKIFKFLFWLFGLVEKRLIGKLRLISRFMTSQHGKQTLAIHILSNISISKGNQTMKFGQLVDMTWEIIFLKSDAKNVVEKLFPGLMLESQDWVYIWINSLKFDTVCFYCVLSWGYLNILKLTCKPLPFNSYATLLKNKRNRSGTSLPASFSA